MSNKTIELIEFSLIRHVSQKQIRGLYGVDVSKVREVIRMPKINPLSSLIPSIAGIFELRGVAIPAINLSLSLGDRHLSLSTKHQQIIVSEFNQKRAGFIVSETHRIRHINKLKILAPSSEEAACVTGITLVENNEFLFILNLEKIIYKLEQQAEKMTDFYKSQSSR